MQIKKISTPIKITILLGIITAIALGIFFGVQELYKSDYPKELLDLSDDYEINPKLGKHQILKQTNKDAYYVLHYPDTNIDTIDQWIKSQMNHTLKTYPSQPTTDPENKQQIKQLYAISNVQERYLSIQLDTLENNQVVNRTSRVYDVDNQTFINTDIFKPKAIRLLTQHLRDNINLDKNQANIRKIKLDNTFEDLYLTENILIFNYMNQSIPFKYTEHPNYLKLSLGNTEPEDKAIASTYLDYGYEDTKMVALTFDDGPHETYAYRIMDKFEAYSGQATFFVVGQRIPGREQVIVDALDRGHQIANHSYSHPNFHKLTDAGIIEELIKTETLVKDASGYNESLQVRPPYGNIHKDQISRLGFTIINWDVDSLDWKSKNASTICKATTQYVKDGSIVVMHEIYGSTVESLDCILETLSDQGYKFVTVKELFLAKGIDINPKKPYYRVNKND